MAAYRTEQINVGSIAAPDIGKDLINLGNTLRDNFQTGVANTRNAIADQRAKELFDRQTNEYNREVGLRKAKQDITRDFMNNQSAYGGQPLHDRLNDAVNAEAQRRLTSTPEIGELDALVARQDKGGVLTPQELARKDEIAKKITFSPEEASGIQKESESIVPFQEDAKAILAAKYAAAGIDNAHALATDATSGLVSRATLQERMDKNREIAQQWNDKVAQANLEAYKLNNQNAVTNAKEQNDINRALISSGTGGGAGGGSGSYKGGGILPFTATANDLNNHISGLGISPSWLYANDERDARKLAEQYNKYTPQQLAYAMDNSVKIGSLGDKYIDQGTFTSNLAEMTPGQMVSSNPYGTGIRTATQVTGQVDPKDLLSSFVPRDIAGYDTKEMDARIAKNLPFLHAGQPEVPTNGVVERNIVTRMPDSLVKSEGVKTNPYDDGKGNITVGVGYNMSGKSRSEIEADFKDANIPVDKIDKLLKRDGTQLTTKEVSDLANVSYDKYGVKKLANIGIDISKLNPTLAEIGVSQAFRGDIVKDGEGYRGKLYNYLKDNDLAGMVDYIQNNNVPKEVKTRLKNVVGIGNSGSEGPITSEQAQYNKSRLDKLLVTDNKAELDKLLASHPAPTKDVLDRVTELMTPQNVVTPGEQIKTSMRTSGLGPMSESSKQQWNVISNILKSSTKIPRDVLVDVYNKYQENIGMPFAEFVKQYAPGGNR